MIKGFIFGLPFVVFGFYFMLHQVHLTNGDRWIVGGCIMLGALFWDPKVFVEGVKAVGPFLPWTKAYAAKH